MVLKLNPLKTALQPIEDKKKTNTIDSDSSTEREEDYINDTDEENVFELIDSFSISESGLDANQENTSSNEEESSDTDGENDEAESSKY